MKMTSLKLDKAEKKAEAAMFMPKEDGPKYPYGTTIDVDEVLMKKLGIEQLPEVGAEFHIDGQVKVISNRQNASEGGDERKGFCLQITEMGLTHGGEEDEDKPGSSVGSLLYPTQGKK